MYIPKTAHLVVSQIYFVAGEGLGRSLKLGFIRLLVPPRVVKSQGKCVRLYVSQSFSAINLLM